MNDLENTLKKTTNFSGTTNPRIFDLSIEEQQEELLKIIKEYNPCITDQFESQLEELFFYNNPAQAFSPERESQLQAYFKKVKEIAPIWQQGRWVFFPWLNQLSHLLPEEDFIAVKTSRNQLLITREEQRVYYNGIVGIAGLSVGSNIALALTLTGGAKKMRIADADTLELSNCNRILTGVHNLGLPKTTFLAQRIYELNPYAEIEIFSSGLQKENISQFLGEGGTKLDVIVDEVDDLSIKYLLREKARASHTPIVMAADNADQGVIDIERYDLEDVDSVFNRKVGTYSYEDLVNLDKIKIGELITSHVGHENISHRMANSLAVIGKDVVSWPQLGSTALLNGGALAYAIRCILTKQALPSSRTLLSLENLLSKKEQTAKDREIVRDILSKIWQK